MRHDRILLVSVAVVGLVFAETGAAEAYWGTQATLTATVTVAQLSDSCETFGAGPCLEAALAVTAVETPEGSMPVQQLATTVTNIGSASATAATWSATVPEGLHIMVGSITIDEAPASAVANYDGTTRRLTISFGTAATSSAGGELAAGGATTIAFQAEASAPEIAFDLVPTIWYVDGVAPTWQRSVTATVN
ncbi:MAG: Conserved repeat protein [Homoserinimonas sp.]|jgi:uncharacterized repeat protein (TIGR01451 family)|nr:Conserved repeat protein [Homoserinimonas sp.]